MNAKPLTAAALAAAVALAGCTTNPQRQDIGMVIGGVLGGALGSQLGEGKGQTVAVVAGTLLGAAIGGAVGRSMDETDRMKTAHTLETVRTGVPSSWRNPDSGYEYTVTPTNTYSTAERPCREYTVDAVIEGRRETVHGTACREPDGTWRTVN